MILALLSVPPPMLPFLPLILPQPIAFYIPFFIHSNRPMVLRLSQLCKNKDFHCADFRLFIVQISGFWGYPESG
jgi:hypothetical protein